MISTVLILGALLWMRRKWEKEEPDNLKLKVGLALVISGALGNLYDRIAYGFVVILDFSSVAGTGLLSMWRIRAFAWERFCWHCRSGKKAA